MKGERERRKERTESWMKKGGRWRERRFSKTEDPGVLVEGAT